MKNIDETKAFIFNFLKKENYEWIKKTNLLEENNLTLLKQMFLEYMNENGQENNTKCLLFIIDLDKKILKSRERSLIKQDENKVTSGAIKYAQLKYIRSSPLLTSNNQTIAGWMKWSSSIGVPFGDLVALEKSIGQKVKQNASERVIGLQEIIKRDGSFR